MTILNLTELGRVNIDNNASKKEKDHLAAVLDDVEKAIEPPPTKKLK